MDESLSVEPFADCTTHGCINSSLVHSLSPTTPALFGSVNQIRSSTKRRMHLDGDHGATMSQTRPTNCLHIRVEQQRREVVYGGVYVLCIS